MEHMSDTNGLRPERSHKLQAHLGTNLVATLAGLDVDNLTHLGLVFQRLSNGIRTKKKSSFSLKKQGTL